MVSQQRRLAVDCAVLQAREGFYSKRVVLRDLKRYSAIGRRNSHTFSVLQPENGGTAILRGVEVGYQQAFTFLPEPFDDFGAVLNFTYADASQLVLTQGQPAVPLSGVSKNTYNVAGVYESARFGARVAYNYRSTYVVDPLSYFGDGDFRGPYGQLDVSATYHVISNFDLTVETLNVTNNALIDVDRYGIIRG
jgi:iron complex outermembrane recepter protein